MFLEAPDACNKAAKCTAFPEYKHWYRDEWCDTNLNNPECDYDGGDCCKQTNPKCSDDESCRSNCCNCIEPYYKDVSVDAPASSDVSSTDTPSSDVPA